MSVKRAATGWTMRMDESEARVLEGNENSLLSAAEKSLSTSRVRESSWRSWLGSAYLCRILLSCHYIFHSGNNQRLQSRLHRIEPKGWPE